MDHNDKEELERASPKSSRIQTRSILDLITSNRRTTFGFIVLLSLFFFGLTAPFLATMNPYSQNLSNGYRPPFWVHGGSFSNILGTDSLGRDLYSRLLYDFGIALYVAVVSAFSVAIIGTVIGLIAGYYRGLVDAIVSRVVDMWMAFPPVLLSITLILILGNLLNNVILAIVLVDWTRFTRVIRGEVFNIREKEFITSAKSLGFSNLRIIWQEVLPNVLPLVIILVTLEMSIAITVEVLLGFVGLGVPPGTPSWGLMIAEGLPYLQVDPWPTLIPLSIVILVVVGINLLGDGLRDRLDPRLQVVPR